MTATKITNTVQELGLSAVILKALKEIGFEVTFPIQKATIPLLLKGVDVIGQAHTGTGKTAIEQSYLVIQEKEKFKHVCNFIKKRDKKQTIVFAATKQRTQRLAKQEGFKAITIHGDLSQRERDNAMYRFKKGTEDILVATDIAARGIDVPTVGHIINYDVPFEPLMYFHRIGRTARAGAKGSRHVMY